MMNISKLDIHTDSQFVINSTTKWMYNWKKNGWKTANKKPVINRIQFEELDEEMNSGDLIIKWTYVPRDGKIKGNNEADKLAKSGANK